MNYHLLLQSRVEQLIGEGREVIVLGDLNVCVGFMDHCDGHLECVREGFWEHPARAWARGWFGEGVDVVRMFWPDRKAMFVLPFCNSVSILTYISLIITGTHVRPPPSLSLKQ
jgi:AP endonuclease-2